MTVRLYDDSPYDREFEAKVLSCTELKTEDGLIYDVVLDETLFFPEQGGQTSDKGRISDATVLDVQVDKEHIVHHYCNKAIELGTVNGQIDWKHRFSNMQQHSGEHIFTGVAHNIYGLDNVGFHLSDNVVSLDFNMDLTEEQVADIEQKANEVVFANVPIRCWYPTAEELSGMNYRSKLELTEDVRLVEIEGVDLCACCAPHVMRTGEIGLIKVQTIAKYKGGVRITILCGMRALEDYRTRIAVIEDSYKPLSCKQEEIPEKIENLLESNKQLKYDIGQLKASMLDSKIAAISPDDKNAWVEALDLDTKTMRDAANKLIAEHEGICGVISNATFIIGSRTVDCKEIADKLRGLQLAKCGGSSEMIQGSLLNGISAAQIIEVLS